MTAGWPGSKRRWWAASKLLPRIGKETVARTKGKEKRKEAISMVMFLVPQAGMGWPSAVMRCGPVAGAVEWWGMMLQEAPEWMRKVRPEMSSMR